MENACCMITFNIYKKKSQLDATMRVSPTMDDLPRNANGALEVGDGDGPGNGLDPFAPQYLSANVDP